MNFSCEHSGSYDDPATGKPRQFDVRATQRIRSSLFLRLAVECKNLRENYPLIVSCVPRRSDEAFHEIVYSVEPDTLPIEQGSLPLARAMRQSSRSVPLRGPYSLYAEGEPVGKSCDQVGRHSQLEEFVYEDSGIYEKWAQALSSADDLTYLACTDGAERTGAFALSLVFPVLVVPNGRLWQVNYDSLGRRDGTPAQVDRCSYWVGRTYSHRSPAGGDQVTLSHLEILTTNGLRLFVNELCGGGRILHSFPLDHVKREIGLPP